MKKMRRILTMMLAVILVMLLAGCGPSAPSAGQGSAVPAAGDTKPTAGGDTQPAGGKELSGKVRVIWVGFQEEDNLDAATGREREGYTTMTKRLFTDQGHENIEVEILNIPWEGCWAKQRTSMMSKEVDILYTGGAYAPIYYKEGHLRAIDDLVAADTGFNPKELYLPGLYDGARCMDFNSTVHVGLPFVAGQRYIIQDSKLFKDWGQELLPEVPTPELVLEKAKAMTGINPVTGEENYGLFFNPTELNGSTLVALLSYYGANGGEGNMSDPGAIKWALNTPEFKKVLAWLDEAVKYAPPGVSTNQGAEMKAQEGNNVAIFLNNNGATELAHYRTSNDATWVERDVPTMNMGKNGGGWITYDPYVMAKDAQNVDAAWELMKFFTGYEVQKWAYDQYGNTPTIANQDFLLDVDHYAKTNAKVIAASKIDPIFDEQNEFFNSEIVPFYAGYVADRANGTARNVDADLAALQKKAEDWSAVQK